SIAGVKNRGQPPKALAGMRKLSRGAPVRTRAPPPPRQLRACALEPRPHAGASFSTVPLPRREMEAEGRERQSSANRSPDAPRPTSRTGGGAENEGLTSSSGYRGR